MAYLLKAMDEMRRYVMTIMYRFQLRKRDVEERFRASVFHETFAYELGKMKPYFVEPQ